MGGSRMGPGLRHHTAVMVVRRRTRERALLLPPPHRALLSLRISIVTLLTNKLVYKFGIGLFIVCIYYVHTKHTHTHTAYMPYRNFFL